MKKHAPTLSRRDFGKACGAAGAVAAGASLPGAAGAVTPKRGGTIKIAVNAFPNAPDPGRQTGLYAQWAWAHCYDGLFDLTSPNAIKAHLESGKDPATLPVVEPNLAESHDISADGLDYTIRLRKGVAFHNGKELKAEDVEYCISRVMNKEIMSGMRSRLMVLREMKVLDDYTVKLSLKEPMAPFLSFLTMSLPIYPKDSLPLKEIQKKINKSEPVPPGTGPFRLVEWNLTRKMLKYERFDGYRLPGRPYADSIEQSIVSEPTIRFTGIRTGELDYISSMPHSQLAEMTKRLDKKLDIHVTGDNYVVYIGDLGLCNHVIFNTTKPPFNNPDVREAVALAINRGQIALGSTYGLGEPTAQHYTPTTTPYYMDGLEWDLSQDYDKARELMKKAGYGSGLTVTATLQNSMTVAIKVAQIMQQQLAKIGMNLKIELLQRAGYWPRMREKNFEIAFNVPGTFFTYDPDMVYNYYYSFNKTKEWRNFMGYNNDEVDRLLDAGRQELSLVKRKAIYKKMWEQIFADRVSLPLLSQPYGWAFSTRLKGFDINACVPDLKGMRDAWLES